MSIIFDHKKKTITLQTENSTYQMKIDEIGTVLHTYYGAKTGISDKSYAIYRTNRAMSGNPHELGTFDRTYSLDTLPQEISTFGVGDYRITGLHTENPDGSRALQLRYVSHEIVPGKYSLPQLPASYGNESESETLIVTLQDDIAKVRVRAYYGVFEKKDILTRAVEVINSGNSPLILNKTASLNLDFMTGDFELVTFYGKWAKERQPERRLLPHGVTAVGTVRGASSPFYNPSAVLCEPHTTETAGNAYGMALVYSGEFLLEAEKDAIGNTRINLGIHPDDFRWTLESGAHFYTPEAVITFSGSGFEKMTHHFHDFVRENVVRGYWKEKRRPILLNNWEGTYFNFTGEKLCAMAKEAKALGIELFVLDDGWFGKRDDDNSGLGDWIPNEKKLGCSMTELGERIRETGIRFGIWFEPETISEDSGLFCTHPDYAVAIPGRAPNLSRNELIIDMSRQDVQDHVISQMTAVIKEAGVSYVKWDFNRSICDRFSHGLSKERQGEFAHRFILGTYRVLSVLQEQFPEVLFEGCSSGGGRFDLGMLFYTPQIWTSDDTDPIERLSIQNGTSYIYPVNTMGAHVSAVPNHQTGRVTPMNTRAAVAMCGTFGYELDVNKLTEGEKEEVRQDIRRFADWYDVIEYGDYYRLLQPDNETCTVFETASKDKTKALVTAVYHAVKANPAPVYVKLRGLKEGGAYSIRIISGNVDKLSASEKNVFSENRQYSGQDLMTCGLYIPAYTEEYQAWQIAVEELK